MTQFALTVGWVVLGVAIIVWFSLLRVVRRKGKR
jgi:hypothetical protein